MHHSGVNQKERDQLQDVDGRLGYNIKMDFKEIEWDVTA
jgi:hypothetical protein